MTIKCTLSHNLLNLTRTIIEERIVEIKKTFRTSIILTLLRYEDKELVLMFHSCDTVNMGEIKGILFDLVQTIEYSMTSSYLTYQEALNILETHPISEEQKEEWKAHHNNHQIPSYLNLTSYEVTEDKRGLLSSRRIQNYLKQLNDNHNVIKRFFHQHIIYRSYDLDSGFELASSLAHQLHSNELLMNPKVMILEVDLYHVNETYLDFSSIEEDVHGGVLVMKIRDMYDQVDVECLEDILFSWVDWLESIRHSTLIIFWFHPTHISLMESVVVRSPLLRFLELSQDSLDDEQIKEWNYRKFTDHHCIELFKDHIHLQSVSSFQRLKRRINAEYDAYYSKPLEKKDSNHKTEIINSVQQDIIDRLKDPNTYLVTVGKEKKSEINDYSIITKQLCKFGVLKSEEYIILDPRDIRIGYYEQRLRDIKTALLKNRDKLIIIEDDYSLSSLRDTSLDGWYMFERLIEMYSIKVIVINNRYYINLNVNDV